MRSSLLIQINSLRRNNNVFTSVIYNHFFLVSRNSNNGVLPPLPLNSTTPTIQRLNARPTHQTRKPFYITSSRQKNPASQENCASELHLVMMQRFSKVGQTFCDLMVTHGRVHFMFFRNFTVFCMKNWGMINLFRMTWTQFWRLCPQRYTKIAGVPLYTP